MIIWCRVSHQPRDLTWFFDHFLCVLMSLVLRIGVLCSLSSSWKRATPSVLIASSWNAFCKHVQTLTCKRQNSSNIFPATSGEIKHLEARLHVLLWESVSSLSQEWNSSQLAHCCTDQLWNSALWQWCQGNALQIQTSRRQHFGKQEWNIKMAVCATRVHSGYQFSLSQTLPTHTF